MARFLEVLDYPLLLEVVSFFAITDVAFLLLKRALCSQGIDLRRAVVGLFLEFTQTLDFLLLLFADASRFSCKSLFFSGSLFVVGHNPLCLRQLLLFALVLLDNCLLVSVLNLRHHVLDSLLLTLGHNQVLLLLLLDVCQKFGSFAFTVLHMSDSFLIALLDLLDDHLGTLLASGNSLFFPVFLVT